MLKNFLLTKQALQKMHFFFLLQARTYNSFTIHLKLLCELKHIVYLSETVCGIFHFWFCLVFIKLYIFVQEKNMDSLPLENKNLSFKF